MINLGDAQATCFVYSDGYQIDKNKQMEVWTIRKVHLKLPTNSYYKGKWAEPRKTAEGDVEKT